MTTSHRRDRGAARSTPTPRKKRASSFRVGRVRVDQRGDNWYLTYHEAGRRYRPRIGPDRDAAERYAAQINAQLTTHLPGPFSFHPIAITELRERWLEQHEYVLRSSVATIRRYRSATQHLVTFVGQDRVPSSTGKFGGEHAAQFVKYLRSLRVAANGHPHTAPRPLLDGGVHYILNCCRTLFRYALQCRHLPPYSENPFSMLRLRRTTHESARPIVLLTPPQERAFLECCDDWQFPVFLTLMLTGLRPGELTHLLLPEDIDWEAQVLRITNKPALGWQVKTRHARVIPLVAPLVDVLRQAVGERATGPLFRRRRVAQGAPTLLAGVPARDLEQEVLRRVARREREQATPLTRAERLQVCRQVWRDAGWLGVSCVRTEFMRVCQSLGLKEMTSPKMLRHLFATCLQDANVDPLVRNELMGHVAAGQAGGGLAMTAVYTHTRPETKRQQLTHALQQRPAWEVAHAWLARRRAEPLG